MLAIAVDLLTGRYHATTWGRAPQEGDVEWPPSPWRLGRALVSAWYRAGGEAFMTEDDLDVVLGALAVAPRVLAPSATVGQSRHYMPETSGKATSSPVIDAFVRVGSERVTMVWDEVNLAGERRHQLERLLAHVSYLGRADSQCVASLVTDICVSPHVLSPLADDQIPTADEEVVQVLCLAGATTKLLSEDTGTRLKRKLVSAPGGRFVPYVRHRSALEPPCRRTARQTPASLTYAIRFAIDGVPRPPVSQALRVAELARAAALGRARNGSTDVTRVLRGRDPLTDVVCEGHSHCHFLATDEDGDGRLDHLTVFCAEGLAREARDALVGNGRLSSSWRIDEPITLIPIAEIHSIEEAAGGPLAVSTVWRSHTPFVAIQHQKRRGGIIVNTLADQVALELARRGFPEPSTIKHVTQGRHWGSFVLEKNGGQRSNRPIAGFELTFHEPVRGPIALGRHAHIGLGLFLPPR